ncbi:hypothetical protein ACF0H5_000123 [Mactra antiquata]
MFLSSVLVSLLLLGVTCDDQSYQLIKWRLTNLEAKQFEDAVMFNNRLMDVKQYVANKMQCCMDSNISGQQTNSNINTGNVANNFVFNDMLQQMSVIKRAFVDQKQYMKNVFEKTNLVNKQTMNENIANIREEISDNINEQVNIINDNVMRKLSETSKRNEVIEASIKRCNEDLRDVQNSVKRCNEDLRDLQNENKNNYNNFMEQISVLNNIIRTISSSQSSGSPFFCHLGSCYIFGHGATWQESKQKCKTLGGALAIVDNADENNYLVNVLKNQDASKYGYGVFLGASDLAREGTWIYESNGKNINTIYSNFKGSEPNGGKHENCLHLYAHGSWVWNDTNCNLKMGYVCEFQNPQA